MKTFGWIVCASAIASVTFAEVDTSKLPAAAKKEGVTYENDVKPILQVSCFGCHGADRQKGGLRLDSLEAVLKGGEDGKVIVPKEGAKSLLAIAAAQIDPDSAMPPKRGPGGPGRPSGPGGPRNGPPPDGQPPEGGPRPGGPGPGGFGGPGGLPPKPLTTEQVALIRAWIDQGAK